MRTSKHLRLAIAVLGALVVAGAAIFITASATGLRLTTAAATNPAASASPGTAAGGKLSAICQAYFGHLATHLGVSQAKLDAAAAAAAKDTAQDQVKAGKITQAQADAIGARVSGSALCSGAINGLGAPSGRAGASAMAYLKAASIALGITSAQLQQNLRAGQSLSQQAQAKGVSEADFRAKVVAAIKADLDPQVAAGKLTQAQEDARLAKIQTGTLPYWSKPTR